MRILGIDYGKKKIGLAFGDSVAHVAVPLTVIPNVGEETFVALAKKVAQEDIDLVVVGVPLSTGGHHGPEQLQITRAFIKALAGVLSVPVAEEDESYTSAESIRLQREEGAQAHEDALAAMLIVQAYMDKLRSSEPVAL
ncbi:Holliday junction resolvase RuvX [Candidatus Uhrbacteria bacterium]|nr:Holliday junction resolvase RuvX [Candidatus Uhrbacteria bacterium]